MQEAIRSGRTVSDELQQFCDVFGHPRATIWDRYDADDRPALVQKLKIIFGTATIDADDGATTATTTATTTSAEQDSDSDGDQLLDTDAAMYDAVIYPDAASMDESTLVCDPIRACP